MPPLEPSGDLAEVDEYKVVSGLGAHVTGIDIVGENILMVKTGYVVRISKKGIVHHSISNSR